jgi:hypothetical protein
MSMPTQDGGLALSRKSPWILSRPLGAYGSSMPAFLKIRMFVAPTPQMTSACMLSFSAMNRAAMSPVESRSILTSRLGSVLFSVFM